MDGIFAFDYGLYVARLIAGSESKLIKLVLLKWKGKDEAIIPGATSSIYSIGAAAFADSGLYAVNISNNAGEVTSSSAKLWVHRAPVITVQPVAQGRLVGQSVTFSVAATGYIRLEWCGIYFIYWFSINAILCQKTNYNRNSRDSQIESMVFMQKAKNGEKSEEITGNNKHLTLLHLLF